MENPEETYNSLISVENLIDLTSDDALDHIGLLTDLSLDMRKREGIERTIKLSEELQERQLTAGQLATSYYFLANAWANLRILLRAGNDRSWDWEQNEIEKEIVCLRRALHREGLCKLPDERVSQILTNLGNLMNHVGRFVEAVEYWDKALAKLPSFPMALGNRGLGLTSYAHALYDRGHSSILLKYAHIDLSKALFSSVHEDARKGFDKCRMKIESILSSDFLNKDVDMHTFSLGASEQEIRYRQWCLKNRLFLNPLNDLGPYSIAARDILSTPDIVVGIAEGPYYPGYFNQMKQEYVSARYLYYEGINAEQPHFSDKDVLLYNTLDYPSYSLTVEEMKIAFRMAYSLFDKIAYFLNHYFHLSIPEKRVSFRTFWYESQEKKNGLRKDFQQRQNWAFRGLFWLSKDLYEDKADFRESIEPEAQELNEIRNHLEHKYLKVHEGLWSGPPSKNDKISRAIADTLAFPLYRHDFQEKALRLIKIARAALLYLSLAIHSEERRRAKTKSPESIIIGIPLDIWEDHWKI